MRVYHETHHIYVSKQTIHHFHDTGSAGYQLLVLELGTGIQVINLLPKPANVSSAAKLNQIYKPELILLVTACENPQRAYPSFLFMTLKCFKAC